MKCKTIVDPSRDEEVLIYVQKPSTLAKEIEALVSAESTELLGYNDREVVPLSPSDVACFTVENGKVYALTDKEKLQVRRRLYVLEESLGQSFVKINQSCIANIKKIQKFDVSLGGALLVCFENGYRDYVSRRQLKTVKERIGIKQ